MDSAALRAEFPVLAEQAYLNAGTDGPLPKRATTAAMGELERELRDGRAMAHFERRFELAKGLRQRYADALTASVEDVALTTSTTEGIAQTLGSMGLGPEDEILTSDEEHPGLLGALGAARELAGVSVREVPLASLAEAVTAKTTVVACSHVSWLTGCYAPAELAELDIPVILDGAQGVGAVPVDVEALGCDAYAAAGQKWLCGPDGTGLLYVGPSFRERLAVSRRGYANLEDPNSGLDARLHPDARALDTFSLSAESTACALSAIELLAETGWSDVQDRARALAERLVELLREAGREIVPRDPTTLVSFHSEDAVAERAQLAESGVIVRNIPGRSWLRASVGAWNDDRDLERLVGALSP